MLLTDYCGSAARPSRLVDQLERFSTEVAARH